MSVTWLGTDVSTARNKTLEGIIIYKSIFILLSKVYTMVSYINSLYIYLKYYRNLAERERALCKIECQYHNQIRA